MVNKECKFSNWPPASGDSMPIETVFVDILKEFNENETRVHSEKSFLEEIQIFFAALTEKKTMWNSLYLKFLRICVKLNQVTDI